MLRESSFCRRSYTTSVCFVERLVSCGGTADQRRFSRPKLGGGYWMARCILMDTFLRLTEKRLETQEGSLFLSSAITPESARGNFAVERAPIRVCGEVGGSPFVTRDPHQRRILVFQ